MKVRKNIQLSILLDVNKQYSTFLSNFQLLQLCQIRSYFKVYLFKSLESTSSLRSTPIHTSNLVSDEVRELLELLKIVIEKGGQVYLCILKLQQPKLNVFFCSTSIIHMSSSLIQEVSQKMPSAFLASNFLKMESVRTPQEC